MLMAVTVLWLSHTVSNVYERGGNDIWGFSFKDKLSIY